MCGLDRLSELHRRPTSFLIFRFHRTEIPIPAREARLIAYFESCSCSAVFRDPLPTGKVLRQNIVWLRFPSLRGAASGWRVLMPPPVEVKVLIERFAHTPDFLRAIPAFLIPTKFTEISIHLRSDEQPDRRNYLQITKVRTPQAP